MVFVRVERWLAPATLLRAKAHLKVPGLVVAVAAAVAVVGDGGAQVAHIAQVVFELAGAEAHFLRKLGGGAGAAEVSVIDRVGEGFEGFDVDSSYFGFPLATPGIGYLIF